MKKIYILPALIFQFSPMASSAQGAKMEWMRVLTDTFKFFHSINLLTVGDSNLIYYQNDHKSTVAHVNLNSNIEVINQVNPIATQLKSVYRNLLLTQPTFANQTLSILEVDTKGNTKIFVRDTLNFPFSKGMTWGTFDTPDSALLVLGCGRSDVSGFVIPFLAKYDLSGNLLWSKHYEDTCNAELLDLCFEPDGKILASGFKRNRYNLPNFEDEWCDYFLTKNGEVDSVVVHRNKSYSKRTNVCRSIVTPSGLKNFLIRNTDLYVECYNLNGALIRTDHLAENVSFPLIYNSTDSGYLITYFSKGFVVSDWRNEDNSISNSAIYPYVSNQILDAKPVGNEKVLLAVSRSIAYASASQHVILVLMNKNVISGFEFFKGEPTFSVFPSPAVSTVSIKSFLQVPHTVSVFNMLGKLHSSINFSGNNETQNITMEKGVYILRSSANNSFKKIIVTGY